MKFVKPNSVISCIAFCSLKEKAVAYLKILKKNTNSCNNKPY